MNETWNGYTPSDLDQLKGSERFDEWMRIFDILGRLKQSEPAFRDGPQVIGSERVPCGMRCVNGKAKFETMLPRTCDGCIHLHVNGFGTRLCAHEHHKCPQSLGTFHRQQWTPPWCPVLNDPMGDPEPESAGEI